LRTIVTDLDGTLIRTDILIECLLKILRQPRFWMNIIKWGLRSRSLLKCELAKILEVDVSLLPYDWEVVEFLKKNKREGATIVLATASNEKVANEIADYLGIFDNVLASTPTQNLKGRQKAVAIKERFPVDQLVYLGNDHTDIHVWNVVNEVYVVNASRSLTNFVLKSYRNAHQLGHPQKIRFLSILKSMRIHQWVKNTLLFTPLIAAHHFFDLKSLLTCTCSFIAFGLVASSVYIFNDLLDLDDDRRHLTKRRRPFASAVLPLSFGLSMAPLLLVAGITFSLATQNRVFTGVLIFYYIITLLYSLVLKKRPIVDVTVLAGLYTIRIIAGGVATHTTLSFWFVTFSFFLFTSLAYVKRASELISNQNPDSQDKLSGRGYIRSDLSLVSAIGPASGLMSGLILALYLNDTKTITMYRTPQLLWSVCPIVVYWISRIWLRTIRGQMPDDPIVFAIKDRLTWILIFLICLFAVAANLLHTSGLALS
jgi:4-hydroxybenzoate polyprenyltransferase/phosphoserine phosphatase